METILKTAAQYIDEQQSLGNLLGYETDPATPGDPEKAIVADHELFSGVLAQIHYIPLANVRSTLYKYNLLDLNTDSIKYINEQDKFNDAKNLGEYARKTINKLGNVIYTVSGREKNYENIPKIGYKTNDGKYISTRDISLNKNLVNYTLELSENFINQSTYVGVNSAYRQFEVPMTDIVYRQDKYKEYVILTADKESYLPNETNFINNGSKGFITNILEGASAIYPNHLSYGLLTVTNSTNEETFDMPLNGFAIGNTINIQMEMDDNYSAGPRIELIPGKDDLSLQNYARYTDNFGRFTDLNLQLRVRGTDDNTEDDANEYPIVLNDTFAHPSLFNLTLENVNKDSREKYGLNLEFPIVSSSPDIRIYPGFTKYSSLIRDRGDMELGVALLEIKYFPNVNELKLNSNKSTILPDEFFSINYDYDSSNYIFGYEIEALISEGDIIQGVIVYEKKTKELILGYNYLIDNTELSSYFFKFPIIWLIHKKSLPSNMYPDNPESYTVTFDTSVDILSIPPQKVYKYSKVRPVSIVRDNFVLDNWYTEDTFENEYDFDSQVTTDLTLYANWIPVGTGVLAEGGDDIFDIEIEGTYYRVHKFTSVGDQTFSVYYNTIDSQFDVLIVGGGAGASTAGGGAGGYIEDTLTISNGSYTLTVGDGGTGITGNATPRPTEANPYQNAGENGEDSVAFNLTAIGGGGGAGTDWAGVPGGSGGGAAASSKPANPANGGASLQTIGFGNAGGAVLNFSSPFYAAGGGGAGSAGGNANTSSGIGGAGKESSITGVATYYAAGGGGGSWSGSGALGGSSIGGSGITSSDGSVNTGSGGGGGRDSVKGGDGSAGIIIVRYEITEEQYTEGL
jgi:uncharacterized repeat protein (TIGR02543 family)